MNATLVFAHEVLTKVYQGDAYLSIALPPVLSYLNGKDKAKVTRLVYGVVEKHEEFSYMISKLCAKTPRPAVRIVLRMGMYMIKYSDGMPAYAAVNECVELAKTVKREQAGFVNATLKKYIQIQNDLPTDKWRALSIETNYPLWLVFRFVEYYGEAAAIDILRRHNRFTHLRLRWGATPDMQLQTLLSQKARKTPYGYLVSSTDGFAPYIMQGVATVMALPSIIICETLTNGEAKGDVLDLCAAPGGKSVYMAEHNPQVTVYARDIHPHRVELIRKYAKRMNVENMNIDCADGTVFVPDFANRFPYVLVDAPCSGVGVVNSNPDILLRRKAEDLAELCKVQADLLAQAAQYVSVGGRLVYSTCSNLPCENEEIVGEFLRNHSNFSYAPSDVLGGNAYKTFFNDQEGNDGFFAALLIRKE